MAHPPFAFEDEVNVKGSIPGYDQIGTFVSATGAMDTAKGNWTISAVAPEPSELLLLTSGLLGLMFAGRKLRLA